MTVDDAVTTVDVVDATLVLGAAPETGAAKTAATTAFERQGDLIQNGSFEDNTLATGAGARHGADAALKETVMKQLIRVACACGALGVAAAWGAPSLDEGFAAPPRENRPQVWWWFDAGASDAAVTRDLEALARVGVSGFHIYGGSASSPQWVKKVKWALHEAARLDLDVVVCIGVAGCGHPATEPRFAQKDVTFTKVAATAPAGGGVTARLPKTGLKGVPKDKDGLAHYRDVAVLAIPAAKGHVPVEAVRDVSRFFDPVTETLAWPEAPASAWTLLRVGFVPKIFGWCGCYIDHMSRAAFDAHWARVMTPLLNALAPEERAALKGVMCDSWEAGTVSWTDDFAEQFRARRGYDILPWLPVKAGVRLGTPGLEARFLRDFGETVSELIAENHYAYQRDVARRHGLVSIAEAAGPHQIQGDVRRMQGRCDIAMGEFWMPSGHRPLPPQRFMLRDAATAAHVYGLPEVLAEAFTTIDTYWIESPATMKPCADRAFCDGLTRVCYHGMKLSPSLTDRPGAIRNVGTHYNPQTTWFEQSGAFNRYLARCSWMLSQGRFVADCLVYAGDAIGLFAGMKTPEDGLGDGFDYDYCPTDVLLGARVENGWIVLPSGMRYRVLALGDRNPKTQTWMRPGKIALAPQKPVKPHLSEAAMLKLRELVEAGATLAGPRPDGPVSMTESSARYHAAADALWGPRGQQPAARRTVGRGRVLRDRATARAVLAEEGVGRDFAAEGLPQDAQVDWIHRATGTNDIYFVANLATNAVAFTGVFRVAGAREAALWNAVTGERTRLAVTADANGRTTRARLALPPGGSVFVVFGPGAARGAAAAETGAETVVPVPGPWQVQFDPAWGGPKEALVWPTPVDWTTQADPGVRHYSGTAVYRATFDAPQASGQTVTLDLGRVANVADVRVNGVALGTVWTPPFAVCVTAPLKATGNVLEVRVTNLWPNRLIYDAGLPEAERLTRTNLRPYKPGDALLASGLLGPVTLREALRALGCCVPEK